ncbi:hypothetical protein [Shewanella algae]|uniref:hypothetical protein n=1 Tax=Shewanella algae TaxID=38313 RepID=UPI0031F4B70E
MAHTFSKAEQSQGGKTSRRGPGKSTIARRLVQAVVGDEHGNQTLNTIRQILDGKQDNQMRLEVAKMVILSALDVASQESLAKFKADLRHKELILSRILKESSQKQALELFARIDQQDDVEEQEEPDDE